MIDRRKFLAGAATAAVASPFVLRRAWAANPEFTLRLHHLLGPKSPAQVMMLEPFADRIVKDSEGRVKIDIYPSMSLGGAPPQLVRQVADGVVDMIWTVNGYTPGLFPRSEVFELPDIFTGDIAATNLAMHDMFDQYLAEEYKNVHVLWLHVHAGQAIQMADKLVRKPDDFKGLKIRVPGPTGTDVHQDARRHAGRHAGARPAAGARHPRGRRRADPLGDRPGAQAAGRHQVRHRGRRQVAPRHHHLPGVDEPAAPGTSCRTTSRRCSTRPPTNAWRKESATSGARTTTGASRC